MCEEYFAALPVIEAVHHLPLHYVLSCMLNFANLSTWAERFPSHCLLGLSGKDHQNVSTISKIF